MMKYLMNIFSLAAIFSSMSVSAGGYTGWAVPTQVDIERGNGVMVYGQFDNPGNCTISNRFYIKKEHPQYDKIYAALLSAYAAKRKIRAYTHTCEPVSWYSNAETTYNTLTQHGDFKLGQ